MTPEEIIATVAAVTGVPVAAITGRRRPRLVCEARFLSVAAVRVTFPWWTLQQTGDFFGRGHDTVLNSIENHRNLLQSTPHYAEQWSQILEDLEAAVA